MKTIQKKSENDFNDLMIILGVFLVLIVFTVLSYNYFHISHISERPTFSQLDIARFNFAIALKYPNMSNEQKLSVHRYIFGYQLAMKK